MSPMYFADVVVTSSLSLLQRQSPEVEWNNSMLDSNTEEEIAQYPLFPGSQSYWRGLVMSVCKFKTLQFDYIVTLQLYSHKSSG